MMSFRSVPFVMMLVLQEEILKSAVKRECDGSDTQTGEGAFKTVPSRERSSVSPFLPRRHESFHLCRLS